VIVADASVVVDLLLGGGSDAGEALGGRLLAHETVAVPHLLDAEVGQAVRRYALRGDLDGATAAQMIEELSWLPLRRYPHAFLMGRAFALRSNVSVYDALYLALAEVLGAVLLTGDGALAGVPGCDVEVEVVHTGA
jgi:predicted nucleic acid-binding protein